MSARLIYHGYRLTSLKNSHNQIWKDVCFIFHARRGAICWSNRAILSICFSGNNRRKPICAYCWSSFATRNTANGKKTCVWSRSAKIEKNWRLAIGFMISDIYKENLKWELREGMG